MSGKSAARPFKSEPRHPLTGKRIVIRARTQRELDAYLHRLDIIRQEQRLGIATTGDVQASLRGLERKRVTLREAAESYAQLTRLAPKTRKDALHMVCGPGKMLRGRMAYGMLSELAGERLEALTPPRLAKHFRALAERATWDTVLTAWRTLRALIRHAAEQGWIVHAPYGLWRPPAPTHKKRKPTRECCRNAGERERLLAAAAELELELGRRLVAPIACGLYLGLRNGELAGLEWRDVMLGTEPFDERPCCQVTIERQYNGAPLKRGEARTVEGGEALACILAAHKGDIRRGAREPVFPRPSGGHVLRGDVVSASDLQRVAERAGLGNPKLWSPHSLRDSFVTIEAQTCGGDLRRLAERTGHRSLDSLLRYLQPFERAPRLTT